MTFLNLGDPLRRLNYMRNIPFLFFALFLFLAAPALWAKSHPTPTPTDLPDDTPTFTPTDTPTPLPVKFPKLYTFDAMWGSQGQGNDQLNDPEGIAIAPDGNMVIADTANCRVLVWDTNGKPLRTIGTCGVRADWRNPPQFDHPSGVFADASGQIYVADSNNQRIVVLDKKGLVNLTWGSQGQANGQFNLPRSLSKDHYGNFWVLDTGNSRVQTFSPLGNFISTWGTFGAADSKSNTLTATMNNPLGMALNHIDQTVIADTGNFRMEVFNNGGVPVTVQGWFGDGPFQFKEPSGVAITNSGIVAIADGIGGRVLFYNSRNGDFELLGQWKAKEEILNQNFDPKFRSIACDSQNRLYLTDIKNNVIIRLKPLKEETFLAPTLTPTPSDVNPYGGVGYPIR